MSAKKRGGKREVMVLGLVLASALVAGTVQARPWPGHPVERHRSAAPWLARAGDIGPDAAASRVRRATGGRVLSVRAKEKRGRVVYRVKVLLPGGRVRILHVDGRSGALLE